MVKLSPAKPDKTRKEKTKQEIKAYLKAHKFKAKDVDDELDKAADAKSVRHALCKLHGVDLVTYQVAGGQR